MDNETPPAPVRLSGFSAECICIWHHRLRRTTAPRPASVSAVVPPPASASVTVSRAATTTAVVPAGGGCVRAHPRLRAGFEFVPRPARGNQAPDIRGMLLPDGMLPPDGMRPPDGGNRPASALPRHAA
jgi:hypothetical protein